MSQIYPVRAVSPALLFIFIIFCGCQESGEHGGRQAAGEGEAVRKTVELSNGWQFQIDIRNIGEEERWFAEEFDRSGWGTATVPGAWDCYETALWGFEGIGWYAVTIDPEDFESGKRAELIFNRVMYYSKVWLNGEYIGENLGGYLPFSFNITRFLKPDRENILVIRVDNVPRIEWLPAAKQIEWIQYGGILQKVELVSTSQVYIGNLTINTEPENTGARIICSAVIVNETGAQSATELNIEIGRDPVLARGSVKVESGPDHSARISMALTLENVELWSPETPVLYRVTARLTENGAALDERTERFGIRKVSVEGTAILLNGKPVVIKGVNRYYEYGRFGPNVPEDILRE